MTPRQGQRGVSEDRKVAREHPRYFEEDHIIVVDRSTIFDLLYHSGIEELNVDE